MTTCVLRWSWWLTGAVLAISTGCGVTGAFAQERTIARSSLPPAVERVAQEQAKGAEVKGFSTEMEQGARVYEMETVVAGHTRDVQISQDGTVTEVEEEVALASLPVGVQRGLRARAGAARITKIESLTKKGALVAYEASTRRGAKKGEVQVGPEGGRLARPE